MAGGAEVVAQAVAPNVEPTKEKLSGNESSWGSNQHVFPGT